MISAIQSPRSLRFMVVKGGVGRRCSVTPQALIFSLLTTRSRGAERERMIDCQLDSIVNDRGQLCLRVWSEAAYTEVQGHRRRTAAVCSFFDELNHRYRYLNLTDAGGNDRCLERRERTMRRPIPS